VVDFLVEMKKTAVDTLAVVDTLADVEVGMSVLEGLEGTMKVAKVGTLVAGDTLVGTLVGTLVEEE